MKIDFVAKPRRQADAFDFGRHLARLFELDFAMNPGKTGLDLHLRKRDPFSCLTSRLESRALWQHMLTRPTIGASDSSRRAVYHQAPFLTHSLAIERAASTQR